MTVITPTASTFTQVEPSSGGVGGTYLAAGALGTRRTLDLTAKFGATLLVQIGRVIGTALTRSGYVSVRRTNNDGLVHPNTSRDAVSTIATAQNTTLSAGNSIGDTTIALTSATGFNPGDTLCIHTDSSTVTQVEFCRILSISSNTLTLESPLKMAHTSADRVNSMADMFSIWLPGGDIYEIRALNNSGQALIFAVYAQVYASDTVA